MKKSITTLLAIMISLCSVNASTTMAIDPKATSINEEINYNLKKAVNTSTVNKCGDNLTWKIETINGQNVLTIAGKGEMYNFDSKRNIIPPWDEKDSIINEIIIEEGVTSIGDTAFSICDRMTSITIPDTVTSIGKSAFSLCTHLETIEIPNSVKAVDEYAFRDCGRLVSVILPNSLTSIAEGTFMNCNSLTEITLPDSVTTIGKSAFSYCSSLKSIKLSTSLTNIDDAAFANCNSLTSIALPDSVTDMGNCIFNRCTSLTSIIIPETTNIGWGNFYKTPWLENKQQKNPIVIINGTLITGATYNGSVIIPDSVTKIVREAFSEGKDITSVTIPNSVSKIDEYTFVNCTNLVSITIPASVTSISGTAFNSCPKLKVIKGYTNTEAERFAKQKGISFESLGEEPLPTSTTSTTKSSTTITTSIKEGTLTAYGDSNYDGNVDLSDAVLIMQTLSNPSKFKLTDHGRINADCYNVGDGVTNADALAIQKYKLSLITSLPEKK